MDLKGKNVAYIGGFGGIGQKCLHEFLTKGIQHLAIMDCNENVEVLDALQKGFPSAKIFYIKLDITDKENIDSAYKSAINEMGRIDVVVNGCGLMNDRLIDLSIQVNLTGVIHSCFAAMSCMSKQNGGDGGWIVNISSVAGLEPTGMFAVYAATKFGVTAFTRSMGNPAYYGLSGVGFITICPGLTDTSLLHNPGQKATIIVDPPTTDRFAVIKKQSAESCAKNLVKSLEMAKNGAVYMLDMDEIKEIEFPVHWKPTPIATS